MKIRILSVIFAISAIAFAPPCRASLSDSLDVLHYEIHVDTLNYSAKSMRAHTKITFSPRQNGFSSGLFDLLHMQVDSIRMGATALTWSYNDTLLRVNFPSAHNAGDTIAITVWYQGQPQLDASGFGGFYFSDTSFTAYIYNIGVGFDADPQAFGRVWFPCKDNFTDKSTFEVWVRVRQGQQAICGGTLQSRTNNGDGTETWYWKLRDPIPSYLASMAVSTYIEFRDSFVSVTGDTIPIRNYCKQTDSMDAVVLFQHLHNALSDFENRLGPFRWERVGYVGVPFNAGAMEHATNIAFPTAYLNGTLVGETTMAHELSHHWFGDLVTCTDAPEMWLNEGFASYSEALFTEAVYGQAAFINYVRDNAADVLRRCHIVDGGFRAVSGVPHSSTYGKTVYDKGSMVAHSLRGYLGDSLFFAGLRYHFNLHPYGNANSDTLRNSLEFVCGYSLADFFDAWVYQPGFLAYEVDSFVSVPSGGNFDVTVYVKQKGRANNILCNSNRLELQFISQSWQKTNRTMVWTGANGSYTFQLPFNPEVIFPDPSYRLADASVEYETVVRQTGLTDCSGTYFSFTTDSLADSALVRVTHFFVPADSSPNYDPAYQLSPSRSWKIEGLFTSGFHATAEFIYDGSVSSFGANAYIDNPWLNFREDSLVLMYRPGSASNWMEAPGLVMAIGSPNDKKGSARVPELLPGEYAFAKRLTAAQAREDKIHPQPKVTLFPNPAHDTLHLQSDLPMQSYSLINLEGKRLRKGKVAWQNEVDLDISELPPGVYLIQIHLKDGGECSLRFTKQ